MRPQFQGTPAWPASGVEAGPVRAEEAPVRVRHSERSEAKPRNLVEMGGGVVLWRVRLSRADPSAPLGMTGSRRRMPTRAARWSRGALPVPNRGRVRSAASRRAGGFSVLRVRRYPQFLLEGVTLGVDILSLIGYT